MLRLKSLEVVNAHMSELTGQDEGKVAVVFRGWVGDDVHFMVTAYMPNLPTDADLIVAAEDSLRHAVVQLAHELQTKDIPQSQPGAS